MVAAHLGKVGAAAKGGGAGHCGQAEVHGAARAAGGQAVDRTCIRRTKQLGKKGKKRLVVMLLVYGLGLANTLRQTRK